jgi:hypothetical protein
MRGNIVGVHASYTTATKHSYSDHGNPPFAMSAQCLLHDSCNVNIYFVGCARVDEEEEKLGAPGSKRLPKPNASCPSYIHCRITARLPRSADARRQNT